MRESSRSWLVSLSCVIVALTVGGGSVGRLLDLPFVEQTLPNGLRVVVSEDRHADRVAVGVWYGAGSRAEPAGQNGLAHVAEHVFQLSATDGAPEGEAKYGPGVSHLLASTSYDRTRFMSATAPTALGQLLTVEARRMADPVATISRERMQRAIREVLDEIDNKAAQPDAVLRTLVQVRTARSDSSAATFPLGNADEVARLQLDDVRRWIEQHYTPKHAVVAIAGAVTPDDAVTLVSTRFRAIPDRSVVHEAAAAARSPDAPSPAVSRVELSGPANRVYMIWSLPGRRALDASRLDVLRHLIRDRLEDDLVHRRRLATFVSATFSAYETFSRFEIVLEPSDPREMASLTDTVRREVEQVAARSVTEGELRRLLRALNESMVGGLYGDEGLEIRIQLLAEGLLFYGDAAHDGREWQRLAALTPASLADAAARWLGAPPIEILVHAKEPV